MSISFSTVRHNIHNYRPCFRHIFVRYIAPN
nr:MAG TPA: hypothetical protein [Caudoviricetes sp.]DAV07751.1 MAG TPA: hypothetical protein [Caudoviricetes sp.]